MLKKQMKETSSLLLSDNSFDILLFIFNTVLQNQDESKSKDFRACKIIMYAAASFPWHRQLPLSLTLHCK